jgi:hypothetical protein
MSIRVLALCLLCAAGLLGQRHRFSWQEACFKNPSAVYCQGHEYFSKHPSKPTKDGASINGGTDPFPSTPEEVTPSVIVAGGIDWRFADPLADALVGFNFGGRSASPIARGVVAQLGANHFGANQFGANQFGGNQGLTDADIQRVFNRLCGVDQVAISVRDNGIVVMVSGGLAGSTLPALEAGWKAVPVSQNAMLIGHADAVDQAVERIATKSPPGELTRAAEQRSAHSEFWAVGSAGFVGPQAVTARVKRFSLTVSTRNQLTSDLAFEFNGVPSTDVLRLWPTLGDPALEGDVVHIRMSVAADEAQQTLGHIAASPLGQRLAALVNVGRYLPFRDTTVPSQSKPVIYGLDAGPRVVNQD